MRDRNLTHMQIIAQEERKLAILGMQNDQEHEKLRQRLVDQYGEEGVKKVEETLKRPATNEKDQRQGRR